MADINKLIEQTELLLAAATPGEWHVHGGHGGEVWIQVTDGQTCDATGTDIEIMSSAPTALRALIDEVKRTRQWHTPRSAPKDGTNLRLWIDECDGFEHPDMFLAEDFDGRTVFKQSIHGSYCAASLWRYADDAPRPSDGLVVQSHAEFEEDDDDDD